MLARRELCPSLRYSGERMGEGLAQLILHAEWHASPLAIEALLLSAEHFGAPRSSIFYTGRPSPSPAPVPGVPGRGEAPYPTCASFDYAPHPKNRSAFPVVARSISSTLTPF